MTAKEERNEKGKMLQTISGQREQIKRLEAELEAKDDEAGELDANLELCKARLADKQRVFDGFMDRIDTMALVYGQLQQSDSGNMNVWMHASSIVSQYGFADKGVRVSVDIPMDLMLNAEEAVPCGWIINELVSNAFKHAFPNGRAGKVKVAMKVVKGKMSLGFSADGKLRENDRVELVVSDNGVGLPEGFSSLKSKSLGMTIARSLVEQIGGSYNVETSYGHGTKFTIRFPI